MVAAPSVITFAISFVLIVERFEQLMLSVRRFLTYCLLGPLMSPKDRTWNFRKMHGASSPSTVLTYDLV